MEFLTLTEDGQLQCQDRWCIDSVNQIKKEINAIELPDTTEITIDGAGLTAIDSAGAWQLQRLRTQITKLKKRAHFVNFEPTYFELMELIFTKADEVYHPTPPPIHHTHLYWLGSEAIIKCKQVTTFLSYVGEFSLLFKSVIISPKRWQIGATFRVIQDGGYYALPIIGLLSFLIGVVLAYQMGLQLKLYGANIFIINLSGMAILREFGPLITAIIVAGRTTSAFTAQIGLMKVNEEVDALYAMGLSPINRIAIPRVVGIVIAVPLLTMWADAFGVLGAMVMAKNMLDINMADFLSRFDDVILPSDFWTGIAKAPVFGLLVATVGCFQGFQVSYSSESIGRQTTKSVVQAIFLVIIADAIFSILFSKAGL